ncbi:MAG: hypothetical protein K5657_01760 [Desulfovibrio sp.]|nr:hypothetical protein [Desulfovibrio sp.]
MKKSALNTRSLSSYGRHCPAPSEDRNDKDAGPHTAIRHQRIKDTI